LIVPVYDEIHLVPGAIGEFVNHAHKVHFLVIEVPKAEESNILPLHFGEIGQLRHCESCGVDLGGVSGGFCGSVCGCVSSCCVCSWSRKSTIRHALILVDRCYPQIASFDVCVIRPHLEGNVHGHLVTEIIVDAIVIGAH
jgi:hypothetical protein